MTRELHIKGAIESGRLLANPETGMVYSTVQRGKNKGKLFKLPGSNCNGYIVHTIYYKGRKKQCRAHQIVWISENGIYDKSKFMIDHFDRDKTNNALYNLRLVDALGNVENSTPYLGKLSVEKTQELIQLHSIHGFRVLAKMFGISKSRAHQIFHKHS